MNNEKNMYSMQDIFLFMEVVGVNVCDWNA